MTQELREFQMGWFVVIAVVLMMIVMSVMYFIGFGSKPLGLYTYLMGMIVTSTIIVLFYGMRTRVNASGINIKFGIGMLEKTIPIIEVKSTSLVENKWYYGLGIRKIPGGMLYNIHGLNAVERNWGASKNIIRIGSQNPQVLAHYIENCINQVNKS